MRKLTIISLLIILFNCKGKEDTVISEFSEKDAYEIINKHFIGQLNEYDSIIYWNNRQLKSPEFERTNIDFDSDEIPVFQHTTEPFPLFTSEFWKTEKIKGIRVIESKEYSYYFRKNDSINLEQLWNSKYNGEYVHNVSYPIYNPKTNIAIVKDYNYRPFLICGTDLDKLYYFKKTKSGWIKLK